MKQSCHGRGLSETGCHKTRLSGARVEIQEDGYDTACNCTQSSHHPGLSMDRVTRQDCNRTDQLLDTGLSWGTFVIRKAYQGFIYI
jgi:hypothetical protein